MSYQDCHKIGNQGNRGIVKKIENDQRNQGKVRKFCKIFWKIKIFGFKEI